MSRFMARSSASHRTAPRRRRPSLKAQGHLSLASRRTPNDGGASNDCSGVASGDKIIKRPTAGVPPTSLRCPQCRKAQAHPLYTVRYSCKTAKHSTQTQECARVCFH
ncbi:hypothetical protein LSTR_LSTR012496 [Laodelphax striatellus]|uniref:Uncharacterized protein n=1 Tax=Laodelphax striatellus TaxID=195883 RepID=A0A482XME7_LAOST|nr:hypothetical protein LSTR_LSTR012496 [Laodelphax striatellus]